MVEVPNPSPLGLTTPPALLAGPHPAGSCTRCGGRPPTYAPVYCAGCYDTLWDEWQDALHDLEPPEEPAYIYAGAVPDEAQRIADRVRDLADCARRAGCETLSLAMRDLATDILGGQA